MRARRYKDVMSNELIVGMVAAVGLAGTAILIARFRARDALQQLRRPAGPVRRADGEEAGR